MAEGFGLMSGLLGSARRRAAENQRLRQRHGTSSPAAARQREFLYAATSSAVRGDSSRAATEVMMLLSRNLAYLRRMASSSGAAPGEPPRGHSPGKLAKMASRMGLSPSVALVYWSQAGSVVAASRRRDPELDKRLKDEGTGRALQFRVALAMLLASRYPSAFVGPRGSSPSKEWGMDRTSARLMRWLSSFVRFRY